MKKIKFEIEIKFGKGHKHRIGIYHQNQIKYLHRECNRRARQMREEISYKISNISIKFYGSYSIKRKGKL